MECAVLYEHAHDRTSALIQLCFDDDAVRFALRIGFEFLHFCYEQDVFQEVIKADLLLGRNRGHDDIAAPVFRGQGLRPAYQSY